MKVLGIDPGTGITGYGLIEEDNAGLAVIDFGTIQTAAGLAMPERLLILYEKLNEVILLHQPDSAAVEKLFFQKNVRTALSVGQARGVILLCLARANIPIGEYTPLEVKQAVAGYGGAEKLQVQLMVKALLNLEQNPKPDDAADALAVAICHLHSGRLKMLEDGVE